MGKGCLREDHPLLLGMTGFWGTPIANEKCRTADVILAVGTRLAEANSSSWDPRFTFAIPPTRLIHIDADVAEIGRNFPTELGVVADAKLALGRARRGRARPGAPRARAACAQEIAAARRAFAANWRDQWESDQYPAAAGADPERAAQGRARGRLHRHRRRLEQERRRPAVPDHRPRHLHHAQRAGDHGLRTVGGARRQAGAAATGRPSRWSATAASAPTRRWSPPRWRPAWPWSGW